MGEIKRKDGRGMTPRGGDVEWTVENLEEVAAENRRRNALLSEPYDPLTGLNATGERVAVKGPNTDGKKMWIPAAMAKEIRSMTIPKRPRRAKAKTIAEKPDGLERAELSERTERGVKPETSNESNKSDKSNKSNKSGISGRFGRRSAVRRCRTVGAIDDREWEQIRFRHDFEYWAARCVTIRHKLSGRMIPFVLNRPQRRVLTIIERQRLAGRPLRLIMLKARQWGGSTLVQMYFAWIQIIHRRNWHSLICAHVKDTSANIRGMYTCMLDNYPEECWQEAEKPEFKGFERSVNIRVIAGRDCRVTLASSENQESARGLDCSMAHLSEVAFWKATEQRSPEDFVRAVCSGIPREPYTFVALESTANGVGNYFHTEWLRATSGKSDKAPVFVPWHEIEIYRAEVTDLRRLTEEADDYERTLWRRGVTLEAIQWYHDKRREVATHEAMKSEYPSDDVEAFTNTDTGVFDSEWIERLRSHCREPQARGEIVADGLWGRAALRHVRFSEGSGELKVWERPATDARYTNRYVVAVDIGGRSVKSDYSVIAVIDRMGDDGMRPSIVAQWRGHLPHDLLPWKAAMIARWYHDALLVVESNTLETDADENATFALSELNSVYHNMYVRTPADASGMPRCESRVGFHTNVNTKSLVITYLVRMVREDAYTERDDEACNELATYEKQQGGGYAARRGNHDDILMTRAIGLYVASTMDYPPEVMAGVGASAAVEDEVEDDGGLARLLTRRRW